MDRKYTSPVKQSSHAPFRTNPYVLKSRSHHKSVAHLPGGDSYTKGRRILRKFGGFVGVVFLVCTLVFAAVALGVGNSDSYPEAPSASIAESAFQKATPPSLASHKYLTNTTLTNPKIENVVVGRVVRNTGPGESGFSCQARAVVTYENSSIQAVSNMRVNMTYNALLRTWTAQDTEIESTNYHPLGAPSADQIQGEIMTILRNYDAASATAVEGGDIEREGTLDNNGGDLTFKITKYGAGADAYSSTYSGGSNTTVGVTNGKYNLIKTVKIRVAWSDIDGWVANVAWLGTLGADDNVIEAYEDAAAEGTSTDVSCASGDTVEITGVITDSSLTLAAATKFMIDGTEITTITVSLTGYIEKYNQGETTKVKGVISSDGIKIILNIPSE